MDEVGEPVSFVGDAGVGDDAAGAAAVDGANSRAGAADSGAGGAGAVVEAAVGAGAGMDDACACSRQVLVMGTRRSRPKLRTVILGPGGYCRRLNSAASTMRNTFVTSSASKPAARRSATPRSCSM